LQARKDIKDFGLPFNGNRQRPQVLYNLIFLRRRKLEPVTGEKSRKGHPTGCVLLILEKFPEKYRS